MFKPTTRAGTWTTIFGMVVLGAFLVAMVVMPSLGTDTTAAIKFFIAAPLYIIGLSALPTIIFGVIAVTKRERGLLPYLMLLVGLITLWIFVVGISGKT